MSIGTRCMRFDNPGVGVLHLHHKWWSPWRTLVWFQPEGRRRAYLVPPDRLGEFAEVKTLLEAMALIRREEQDDGLDEG